MDNVHDDRYLVFMRFGGNRVETSSDGVEQALASCSTYEEARRIRDALHDSATGECVIRFVGPSGGGD